MINVRFFQFYFEIKDEHRFEVHLARLVPIEEENLHAKNRQVVVQKINCPVGLMSPR